MEVDGEMQQEESAEIHSPKRKVIRAESEETQDYVRETLAISQEEAQEIAFGSALSEPRGPIYFCDNRCSAKAVRYWQFASVVVEEGGDAHTVNLCQQCYNEQVVQQGKPRLKSWQWRAVVERKAHRGRIWKVMEERTIYTWNVGVFHSQKGRSKKDCRRCLAGQARRDPGSVAAGISGASQIWVRDGSWEEFEERYREERKSLEWTLGRIREAYVKVSKDEIGRTT